MTLCGQAKLHWPHWMQRSGSQIGHHVGDVALLEGRGADGKVPSTGNWLTRSSSPRPSIILAVTSRTNSGACAGTIGERSNVLVAAAGTVTSNRCASVWSTASKFLRTTSAPFDAVALLDRRA